ncbi:GDSL esterase/lipase EXL3 [Linum perenne]
MLISFTCFSPFPLSFHISPFAGCFRIPLSKLARPLQCPVLCLWTTATILPNHLSIMARMILFCSVVVIMIMVCDAAMAPPRKVPAMLIFGDSILDSGNNNYVNTIVKCNFQPYGRDFVTRKPTGRFCNGKVPSDFAVSFLGLKDLLPPSLDPTLTIRDLATGVSFASGGSGYDPETARGASVLTMSDQLEMFKEYKSKIEKGMGGKTAAKIVSESAYLIGVGSDDLVNTYFPSPIKRQQYDVQSYTDLMATYATSFYEELYMLGARRIGVLSLPPVGCLPSQRTVGGGLYRNCSDTYNQAAQLFNSKLSSLLQSLSLKHPDGLFVYLDVYDRLTSMVQNPAQYAEVLGVKEMLPPYLDPRLDLQQLLTGVCFASAGSGYDPRTFQFGKAIPIKGQFEMLRDYIRKINASVGAERTESILSESAYITFLGSNDLTNPLLTAMYDEDSHTDIIIRLAQDFYRMNKELPGARVVLFDLYNPVLKLVQNPAPYGIEEVKRGCCGTGNIEAGVLCAIPGTCPDASKYLFWDSAHPTDKASKIMTYQALTPNLSKLFY